MSRRGGFLITLLLVGGLLLATGCRAETENESEGSGPVEIQYDGPRPDPGMGNVYGVIRWNDQPAAGLDMLLCQDFSSFSGCRGVEYRAVSETDGSYLFANVAPGTYAVSVRLFDSDEWLYVSGGIFSAADIMVIEGKTAVVPAQNIYKLDLQTTTPPNQAKVAPEPLTLAWKPYPDAAYYEIYLTPDEGEAIFVNERVDGTEISADLLPVNCEYRWELAAFNSAGARIAETADFSEFRVVGADADCVIQITAPVDGTLVPAEGIVLDWEPHPLAASYKILMWDDTDPERTNILDFVTVTESQFAFNGALTPDTRYVWSIYAYDADGREVAGSEIYDFTVIP